MPTHTGIVHGPAATPSRLPRGLWITWDHHRRTSELARALGIPLKVISLSAPRAVRYLVLGAATVLTLVRTRPRLLIVQNPSIILAALACGLRRLLGYTLVVDRHSNFEFANTDTGLFNAISNYSLRHADLTIVTNTRVKEIVEAKGGRGFILPDKLPTLAKARVKPLSGRVNVVFVCTYSPDEPVIEVIEAARLLPADVHVHITGNNRSLPASVRENAPPNLVFTGYLPSADYESLLLSADLVLELTTRDHTLLCGAYEAVSLGKPLIISRTEALTQYFRRGAVTTENTAPSIANAIVIAQAQLPRLNQDVRTLASELTDDWNQRFDTLVQHLAR